MVTGASAITAPVASAIVPVTLAKPVWPNPNEAHDRSNAATAIPLLSEKLLDVETHVSQGENNDFI